MTYRPHTDEDDVELTYFGSGQAHHVSDPDREPPDDAGRILVPDPEQRYGWREHYVKRPTRQQAKRRPMGFRYR